MSNSSKFEVDSSRFSSNHQNIEHRTSNVEPPTSNIEHRTFSVGGRRIGPGHPVYVVAEVSANHQQNFDQTIELLQAAKEAGADAVKLQTYTPDTLTIRSNQEYFSIGGGTLWDGCTLYDLYREAYMPWEWQPKLKTIANELGLDLFSTAFDSSAVNFLEELGVPVHKVASFEIVDIPLVEKMARTGKPLIISTGMATLSEIEEAVQAARKAGAREIVLLKCTSAYPALAEEMNLRTIPHLREAFQVPVGLSDHTLGIAVPVAAVALGACLVEKHFTLSRSIPGPDSAFSLEPQEFQAMVEAVRTVEEALGQVHYGASKQEAKSRAFRRSLFVVKDMEAGEAFTEKNLRSIRPSHGLHPRHLNEIIGRCANRDIRCGTPLTWDMIGATG
jgi:pseudaminic acid synthase